MQPPHYLQLAAAALISDNVPLPLRAPTAAAYFLNRHIRAESTSVVLIKVDMVEMSSTQSQANPSLTLLVNGCSVHSISDGFSYETPVTLEMLVNKPWTQATVQTALVLWNWPAGWWDAIGLHIWNTDGSVILWKLFLLCLGARPDGCLNVGSYSPLDSSYMSLFKGVGGVSFLCTLMINGWKIVKYSSFLHSVIYEVVCDAQSPI